MRLLPTVMSLVVFVSRKEKEPCKQESGESDSMGFAAFLQIDKEHRFSNYQGGAIMPTKRKDGRYQSSVTAENPITGERVKRYIYAHSLKDFEVERRRVLAANFSDFLLKVRRTFEDTEEVFDDGAHILYVNGECQSESPLGRLMHDFFCSDPNDMYSDVLAERVRFFKEDEKGVAAMCKVMEEIHNDGISIGEARGEIRGAETERLKNIKSLIQRMGVTAEVAMDALNIAKDDQPKYLALL